MADLTIGRQYLVNDTLRAIQAIALLKEIAMSEDDRRSAYDVLIAKIDSADIPDWIKNNQEIPISQIPAAVMLDTEFTAAAIRDLLGLTEAEIRSILLNAQIQNNALILTREDGTQISIPLPAGTPANGTISDLQYDVATKMLNFAVSGMTERVSIDLSALSAPGGTIPTPKFEYSIYKPNRYEYTALTQNTFGPLYIVYKQADELPTVTIDDEYFDATWSTTRPAHSSEHNTYYAVAYDEGTQGTITDLLGVRAAELLEADEEISIYVAPDNTSPAPATGTVTPASPWQLHNPLTDTNAQRAYFTIRKAYEPDIDISETEVPSHTHFRVTIGSVHTQWQHLPFLISKIDEEIERLIDALLGDESVTLTGTGTPYNWSDSRPTTGDETTRTIQINNSQNIYRADFTTQQQNEIAAGTKYTLVLEAINGIDAFRGSPPRIDIIINSGSKSERYALHNDTITEIEFAIPNADNVFSVGVRAEGIWKGAGNVSGTVRIISAELRTKGSHEEEFDAWFKQQYRIVSTQEGAFANIPPELAKLAQGIARSAFSEPTPADIQAHNIVTSLSDTGILTVTGDFIDVRFRSAGGTALLDPVSTRKVGIGRYEYTGPRNRPLYRIADIPSLWQLNRAVTTLVSGVQQSIAKTLTDFETALQSIQQNPYSSAAQNFLRSLAQEHEMGRTVNPWTAKTGFNISGIGILADDPTVHNRIPADQSSVVFTAQGQLDASHILHAPLLSNYANAGFEKIIVSGWFDFSEDTGFQSHILRTGFLTALGRRNILERNTHGVIGWNRRSSASGSEEMSVDQTILTTNYRPNGYFDDTASSIVNWDIPAGVNSVKMTLNHTENGNPMQSEQTINVDTTADRTLADQTVNFTDSLGNTRAVRVRWGYTLSTRRLVVESGAERLPSFATYEAIAHRTIDILTVVVSQSVTRSVHTSEQRQFVPLSPVSGTGISTSSENEYFIIMMLYRNAAGNAEGAIVTRERTSGNVISYQRQDLGLPFLELDISRLLIGDFRIKQSDSFVAYPSREAYTDSELRAKATAADLGLGEVTAGNTHEYSFNEFVINYPLKVTKLVANEIFVDEESVLTSSREERVILPFSIASDIDETLTGDDAQAQVGAAWWIMPENWETLGFEYISIITFEYGDDQTTYTKDSINYHPLQDRNDVGYIDKTHHLQDFIEIASRLRARQGRQTYLEYNKTTRRLDTVNISGVDRPNDLFMKIVLHH